MVEGQPAPADDLSPLFVQELLVELRAGRYSPSAWLRFLHRSWQRSVDDARSSPALLGSLVRQSALLEALALAALLWQWRRSAAGDSFRQARRATWLVLVQQGYVALHLGMTQTEHTTPRFASLGAANFLTLLRGVCATLLFTTGSTELPLFRLLVIIGGSTDALDGAVARRLRTESRLGRMLDPAADICFYSTAVLAAVRRGTLPRWFGWLVLARFLAPAGAGFYRYFRWARTLEAAHTAWGKVAGVLLTLLVVLSSVRSRTARALCVPTSALLTVAGALQCRRALQPSSWAGATDTHKMIRQAAASRRLETIEITG